jgi:hypothetical protein
VFGNPRHPYFDPEYWSARLNTEEGLIEMRFTLMAHHEGPTGSSSSTSAGHPPSTLTTPVAR